ncbi:serine/threonine-protein phosphatase 4 regulatory subunit 4 [Ditylenchus destructor]|uniref:Serine/threonine-protein phosphatase 4 regulatory subunit 4 n=1 Tax=Ditylenchus destructor TaxID=166010 RepID=A0AAD4N059_9BILA|nr:serine/threonine-protein phosphatase 4 regulatory subunit 4 [Ditylenchus destructor]
MNTLDQSYSILPFHHQTGDNIFEKRLDAKEKASANRRSLEALFAAVEEEFDLRDSAVDTAIKTLRTGREIQKLATIRNFGELLELQKSRQEAIDRVLPVIQESLALEPSNLDIHCEAAVVFKNLIKDKKYSQLCSGLSENLLGYILQNIDTQKENVTAAAWLESLVEIADSVPVSAVTDLIVPLAVSQGEPTRRVQRRVISARLIEKLCAIIPPEFVRKDLVPCAQMLCQDPSAAVRTTIAQRLHTIAQCLNNSSECVSLILPCMIELCKDEDPGVREAILNTVAVCLPYFTKESKKSVVVPLLRKCAEQALILRDVSLTVVARQLGPWLESLKDVLSNAELKWFLETYCRIVEFSSMSTANLGAARTGTLSTALNTSCRRMCAYNFPCFAMVYGKDHFNDRLLPILERFCKDNDDEVRSTIASGFHEIVQLRSETEQQALLGPFVELMCSGTAEVVQHLTGNLHKTLSALYKGVKSNGNNSKDSNGNQSLNCDQKYSSLFQSISSARMGPVTRVQLDRILIGCNRLIRGTGSWRSHEAYLLNLAVVRHLVPVKDLELSFVPMLQQEVLIARALPCRVAAAQSLLLIMRQLPMKKNRDAIIKFFTETIGKHESCHRRRLLLDIVPIILEHFSREFFLQNFLTAVLRLSEDRVSNIRLQLCRTLSKIKAYLVYPNDDEELSSLEKVVRELLTSEQNDNMRQLIQQFACELSRAETDPKLNRANRTKLIEEKKLWTEVEPEAEPDEENKKEEKEELREIAPRRNSLRRSATGANLVDKPPMSPQGASLAAAITAAHSPPSAWRTSRPDRPKVAIVRPQPQVTVTQRSPSPMPFAMSSNKLPSIPNASDERKSKLPLSTARYRSNSIQPTSSSSSASTTNSPRTSIAESSLKKYRTKSSAPLPSIRTARNASSDMSTSMPSSSSLRRSATCMDTFSDSMTRSTSSGLSSNYSSTSKGIRRPYGLMKVQSTSAVERKPSHMSIRVTSMS